MSLKASTNTIFSLHNCQVYYQYTCKMDFRCLFKNIEDKNCKVVISVLLTLKNKKWS
jgi:uncharacterized membrane protein